MALELAHFLPEISVGPLCVIIRVECYVPKGEEGYMRIQKDNAKTYQELFRENSHDTILGQLPPANRF